MKTGAIVLAAGLGTRMGGAKMERDWQGRPLPVWAVLAAAGFGCDPVVAVVRPDHARLDQPLLAAGASLVVNPDPAAGMASSLACGAAALGDVERLFVLLGDMPLVTSAHLSRLAQALDGDPGKSIAVPFFQGRRGNPVLFDRRHLPALAALSGDQGARHLLAGPEVLAVTMADDAVLADIDTPDDLRRVLPLRE